MIDMKLLVTGGTGLVGNALKVERKNSYLEYSCENNFNPGYGSVTVWVSFDKFNKDLKGCADDSFRIGCGLTLLMILLGLLLILLL